MSLITEDLLEQQCLDWFKEIGYSYVFCPDLAPNGDSPERDEFRQCIPLWTSSFITAKTQPNGPICND